MSTKSTAVEPPEDTVFFPVKVQRPLASNRSAPEYLTYNEDRSIEWLGPAVGENKELDRAMRSRPKRFFQAWVNADKKLVLEINSPLPDQGW